jgi:hypothetical protein
MLGSSHPPTAGGNSPAAPAPPDLDRDEEAGIGTDIVPPIPDEPPLPVPGVFSDPDIDLGTAPP